MRKAVVFLLVLVMLLSCHRKGGKKVRIIPRDDLVSVLEDIYLANGLFSLSTMRNRFPGTDSLSNYRDILQKYGYTLEDLEKTIDYYTSEARLAELEGVYEEVVKDLSTLQERSFEEEHLAPPGEEPGPPGDLWRGDREYHLPRQGRRNKIPFTVELQGPGMYTLSLSVKVHEDDGSRRPFIHVWFAEREDDGGRKLEWRRKTLKKDGKWHQYILAKKLTDPSFRYLKGYLLDDMNKDSSYIKQADIRDIRLDIKPPAPGRLPSGIN